MLRKYQQIIVNTKIKGILNLLICYSILVSTTPKNVNSGINFNDIYKVSKSKLVNWWGRSDSSKKGDSNKKNVNDVN